MTSNPLALKLKHAGCLTQHDLRTVEEACSSRRSLAAKDDILLEGAIPDDVHLVLDGVACRYKMLPSGKRSIMSLMLPGDFCDLNVAILGPMDHAVSALTACTIVDIPRQRLDEVTAHHPRITQALWWASLVDKAVLCEWLVGTGKRSADRHLAHFLCEMLVRYQAVNRATANSFHLPLTQEELGDILGLSAVHVNRVMQQLKENGLIRVNGRTLIIPDVPALRAFAGFNPGYLHLKDLEQSASSRGLLGQNSM